MGAGLRWLLGIEAGGCRAGARALAVDLGVARRGLFDGSGLVILRIDGSGASWPLCSFGRGRCYREFGGQVAGGRGGLLGH